MTVQVTGTTIEISGKSYQLKCPENEVDSIRKAAIFLEKKMQEVRERAHVLSADRIAVFAALNIAHEYLNLEQDKTSYINNMHERLKELHNKIENFFAQSAQMELSSAE